MQSNHFNTIVIGGGHAGLSISYFLKQKNIDHIVFERGRIGESWRSQRWDSFTLNTPNWSNSLPGDTYSGNRKDNYDSLSGFINYLSNYASRNDLPVIENTSVISMKRTDEGRFKLAVVDHNDIRHYTCDKVVVASGMMNEKNIPAFAKSISQDVLQLHAGEYKNPSQLPEGAVMVVGGAQSGCQIVEDLLASGREVYFSTSRVPRARRRYRGKDMVDWFIKTKFFDARTDEITDPQVFRMKQPQISGVGMYGHTVSLQHMASRGTKILGKLKHAEKDTVYFYPDAAENVKFADEMSKKFLDMIDGYIKQTGIEATAPEQDPADEPDPDCKCASDITELDLKGHNITSIIWTTGFGADFNWLKLPVFDKNRNPIHTDGISNIDGLYFLGLPWLRKRKSGVIFGINEDSEYIYNRIIN